MSFFQRADLVQIEFFRNAGDRARGSCAVRYWPCVPRVGESVWLPEVKFHGVVTDVSWGCTVDNKDEPIKDHAVAFVALKESPKV